MKKIFFLLLFFPFLVSAKTITFQNPLRTNNFWEFVRQILNLIFTLAVPLTVVIIIIGGLLLVTAGGNEKQVEMGKKCIMYSLIGLVLIIMSNGIIRLLQYLIQPINP